MALDSMRKLAFAGLGLLSLTRERVEKMVQDLVEQGNMSSEEGRQLADSLMQRAEAEMNELRARIQAEIKKALIGAGVATKEEVQALKERVDELEARLRRLEPDQ